MIIYLEGPDGSGKTTLVQNIWDQLVRKYYVTIGAEEDIPTHPKRQNRISEGELFKKLKKMAKSNIVYVLDRGPLSDIIYRIFDEYKTVTTLSKMLDFLVRYNNKILMVYCHTPDAEKYMLERGDDNPVALAKHKDITRAYNLVMSLIKDKCKYNFAEYDFTKRNSVKTTMDLIDYFCYMNDERSRLYE